MGDVLLLLLNKADLQQWEVLTQRLQAHADHGIPTLNVSAKTGLNPNDLLDLLPEPIQEFVDALLKRLLDVCWQRLRPALRRALAWLQAPRRDCLRSPALFRSQAA